MMCGKDANETYVHYDCIQIWNYNLDCLDLFGWYKSNEREAKDPTNKQLG